MRRSVLATIEDRPLLERFILQNNLQRLRELLEQITDEPQKREILKLLAEEESKDQQARLKET